ncbi:hypothetical protein L1887_33477 [Cichorium endivia]|nr:hypothetical protein L1887_33477 [Cichorium endivia]
MVVVFNKELLSWYLITLKLKKNLDTEIPSSSRSIDFPDEQNQQPPEALHIEINGGSENLKQGPKSLESEWMISIREKLKLLKKTTSPELGESSASIKFLSIFSNVVIKMLSSISIPSKNSKKGYPRCDPVFAMRGSMHSIQRDMIMLENQIPLFILDRLLGSNSCNVFFLMCFFFLISKSEPPFFLDSSATASSFLPLVKTFSLLPSVSPLPNRGLKLFGVRITDGSIRKSASMGNLSHCNDPEAAPSSMDFPEAAPTWIRPETLRIITPPVTDTSLWISLPGRLQAVKGKKGVPWTEEEHRMFLLGLQKLGKGDWRGIARNYVITHESIFLPKEYTMASPRLVNEVVTYDFNLDVGFLKSDSVCCVAADDQDLALALQLSVQEGAKDRSGQADMRRLLADQSFVSSIVASNPYSGLSGFILSTTRFLPHFSFPPLASPSPTNLPRFHVDYFTRSKIAATLTSQIPESKPSTNTNVRFTAIVVVKIAGAWSVPLKARKKVFPSIAWMGQFPTAGVGSLSFSHRFPLSFTSAFSSKILTSSPLPEIPSHSTRFNQLWDQYELIHPPIRDLEQWCLDNGKYDFEIVDKLRLDRRLEEQWRLDNGEYTPLETPMQTTLPIQTPLPGIAPTPLPRTMDNYNIPTGGTPITPGDYPSISENGVSDGKSRRPSAYMQPPSPWLNQRPPLDVNVAYVEGCEDADRGAVNQPTNQNCII